MSSPQTISRVKPIPFFHIGVYGVRQLQGAFLPQVLKKNPKVDPLKNPKEWSITWRQEPVSCAWVWLPTFDRPSSTEYVRASKWSILTSRMSSISLLPCFLPVVLTEYRERSRGTPHRNLQTRSHADWWASDSSTRFFHFFYFDLS